MQNRRDEHDQAIAILFGIALGRTISQADTEAARLHVIRCASCWERFQQMTEALTGEPASPQVEPLPLPEAPTFGERWRLQRHAPQLEEQPGRWQAGIGYLARLAQEAEQRTIALLISANRWFAGPGPALAHRGGKDVPEAETTLHCTDLPDLEAVVTIMPGAGAPHLVRVAVEISVPSRWPDFSGLRVILDDGARELERVTGRDGRVEFDAIPRERIPTLNVIILPT